MSQKIYVGMSGGVDSAVSAMLLRDGGYDVTGVFIKTWQPSYIECTQKEDRLDAMRVCAKLEIPFVTLDLEEEYKKHVIDYMLSEYKNNRVPNPDVMCNKYIKFGAFLEYARKNNAIIATGHYARIQIQPLPAMNASPSPTPPQGRELEPSASGPSLGEGACRAEGVCIWKGFGFKLLKHKDKSKDQTYFLYQIKKEDLSDIIFPLQNLTKKEVKQIARDNNLHVVDKKESMGICMLGDISMKEFLIKELNPSKGEIRNESEEVVGTHDGVILYTIGEKPGIDYYVYKKDFENNILYVTHDPGLTPNPSPQGRGIDPASKNIILQDLNSFIEIDEINQNKTYQMQTRYHGPLYDVNIKIPIDTNLDKLEIIPLESQTIAISGQSTIVYDGDTLILGGVIS